jgi:hypothetical protein
MSLLAWLKEGNTSTLILVYFLDALFWFMLGGYFF